MDRGDIYHVDLNPVHGREQAGARYVLIISPEAFNRLGIQWVCPITQGGDFARDRGFAVSLSGACEKTQGVVLCNQIRALDLQSRQSRFVEKVPEYIIEEVLARLLTLLE
jgi:mRNA-degrading endonuclease toxin of MazEF toxin-antitoxin module